MIENEKQLNREKELASVCGLYCGACGAYQATQENDTEKITRYSKMLNQTFEETLCDGCRADRKSAHCSKMCSFITCANKKGVEFCGSCDKYPCKELTDFQLKMPHRIELFESQNRIKEIGWQKWANEMHEKYLCPDCNTINTTYDISCRKCGRTPSSKFVGLHIDKIKSHLSQSNR